MSRLVLAALVLGCPFIVYAQPTPMGGAASTGKTGTVDFLCKLTSYRVMGSQNGRADSLWVLCDILAPISVRASFALYKLLDESVVYPSVSGPASKPASGEAVEVTVPAGDGPGRSHWLKFQFDKDLTADQDYELRFSGTSRFDDKSGRTESFSSTRFRFSTSPEAVIAVNVGRPQIQSNTVLNIATAARLVDQSQKVQTVYTLQAGCDDPGDPDCAGRINLAVSGKPVSADALGTELALEGVTDIFGRPVKLAPYKPAPPAVAPQSKDAAAWYFNVLHQAGGGITPTWIADIKAAPVLWALPGQLFFTPSLTADVGSGQVGTTQTNDLINPKLGVSRLFLTGVGVLSELKFTPSFSYQTNREGTNRSMLFDGDLRLYFKQLSNTKADRTLDNLLALRRGDPKKQIPANPKAQPQDAKKAIFGYDLQFYIGTEIGSSLTANSVTSSDQGSQVTVPSFSIVRLRPRAAATFEFWNVTVSLSATPRYLVDAESITRETLTPQATGPAKEIIRLSSVSGWRGYAETSISYAIDSAGHYSINTTWKLGSQPTNFDRTNMVQSGLLVKF